MSNISAGTTTTTALVNTADTSGDLQLQVNGTIPSVTLKSNGAIGVGSTPAYGTSGQVLTSSGSSSAPTWATVSALPSQSGNNGKYLTTDGSTASWGTVSTGAMTLISAATASNSASIAFTNINSTYDVYVFELVKLIPNGGLTFFCKVSTDNGSTYLSSYYDMTANGYDTGNGTLSYNVTGDSNFFFAGGQGISSDSAGTGMNGTFNLFKPSSTTGYIASTGLFSYTNSATGNLSASTFSGRVKAIPYAAINAIKFYFNGGNIVSGSIRMYGISNS